MAGKRKQDANKNEEGFRLFERPAQKRKPFCLQWNTALPGETRALKTESFASAKLRKKRLDALLLLRKEEGTQALRMDSRKYLLWEALEERAGVPLSVAVDFYLKNRPRVEPVHLLLEPYMLAREMRFSKERRMRAADTSEVQLRLSRTRVGLFVAAFRDVPADQISVQDCRLWLNGLAQEFKPKTVANYRREIIMFLNHLMREYGLRKNPMMGVKPPEMVQEEHEFFTLREALRFFRVNEVKDPEICGLVALSAFGSFRTSAVLRLTKGDFRKHPKGILCPAMNQKKGRRYFIENYPENLWRWVDWMPESAFGMGQQVFYRRRTKAYERAGLAPKDNGWRHAFVSHHSAWKQSAEGTAYLTQHKDAALLWDTYKGNASQRNGRLYFKIVPRSEACKG